MHITEIGRLQQFFKEELTEILELPTDKLRYGRELELEKIARLFDQWSEYKSIHHELRISKT